MSTLPCSEESLPAWQKANQPLRLGAMVKGKYARRAYSLQLRPFHCDIVCRKCAPAGEEVDVAAIMGKSRRRLIYLLTSKVKPLGTHKQARKVKTPMTIK